MLSILPPSETEPESHAKRRLLKQLPSTTTATDLFSLLRPYGPLRKVTLITTHPKTGAHTGFRGMATADFYTEEDAQSAERSLHCASIEGNTISVSVDTTIRSAPDIRATAPVFVPRGQPVTAGSQASVYAQQLYPGASSPAPPLPGYEYGFPQPAPQLAVPAAAPAQAARKLIDPCNLFIKNLAPGVSSSDLYQAFTSYGDIVSARVMRDNEGNSRMFGFVSYKHPEEADAAMHAMHRRKIQGKAISVSLHEPKMLRQEKLAAKFAAQNGALSPASASPRRNSVASSSAPESTDGAARAATEPKPTPKLQRKASNSYFRAAMEADNRGETYTVAQLSSLSASVRNEVLAGLLARRIKKLPGFDELAAEEGVYHQVTPEEAAARRQALLEKAARGGESSSDCGAQQTNWSDDEVHEIVEQLVAKLSLTQAVEALDNPEKLLQHTLNHAAAEIPPADPVTPPAMSQRTHSTDSVQDTTLPTSLDVSAVSIAAPAGTTEREKLFNAVRSLGSSETPVEEITDLLIGLPKKERALCLFNRDFLNQKVEEAKVILTLSDDEEPVTTSSSVAVSPIPRPVSALPRGDEPVPEPTVEPIADLATLAALPAPELVEKLQAGALSPDMLPASPEVWSATEDFVAALSGLAASDAKQKLGDRVFRVIKAGGIKGAPKLTIGLLDSEDLRALAHLADSFPLALREKALRLK